MEHLIVACVSQVNHQVHDVAELHSTFVQQGFHILPHAVGLFHDIFRMHNLSFVVDAGSTRDKDLSAITVVNIRATLEADTIVAGTVQMRRRIQMMNLLPRNALDGIVVHLGQHIGVLLTTTNTCRGNKMGLWCQSLGKEDLIAGAYHTTIVQVDIIDK